MAKLTPDTRFERFFREHFARLSYHAFQITGNAEAARDIAQEAFVSLWKKIHDFESESAMKAFLYLTVKNAGLNFLRHEKVKNQFVKTQEESHPHEDTILLNLIKSEIFGEIYKEIEALPDSCKKIFKLTYIDGLKNQEVFISDRTRIII